MWMTSQHQAAETAVLNNRERAQGLAHPADNFRSVHREYLVYLLMKTLT